MEIINDDHEKKFYCTISKKKLAEFLIHQPEKEFYN